MDKRSRSQSLPVFVPPEELTNTLEREEQSFLEDEDNFEADDETSSRNSSRRPSTVAKQEIDQARRLSQKMSTAPRNASPILLVNSSTNNNASETSLKSEGQRSVVGSLYSLGGAVWSYIRGPVETDSNSSNSSSGLFRNRSQSFSNTQILHRPQQQQQESSEYSDSSDAPDFSIPHKPASPVPAHLRTAVEPGRGKIVFKVATKGEDRPNCRLIGRDFGEEEHILSSLDISTIQMQMPPRWNVYTDWILLYSSRGNGFSLTTLYHQLKFFKGPVLVAVKDESNTIFGAFLNQSLVPRQGHYGNGECFLWRKLSHDSFVKYTSTSKNNYFIISEPEYFAVGCGGGKFGLWLEKDLFKGISDPVPTFDNEPLATAQKFDCIAIEIWGLDLNE